MFAVLNHFIGERFTKRITGRGIKIDDVRYASFPKKAKIFTEVGMHKESRMTLEKYEQLLKAHDWFYHMSDDIGITAEAESSP